MSFEGAVCASANSVNASSTSRILADIFCDFPFDATRYRTCGTVCREGGGFGWVRSCVFTFFGRGGGSFRWVRFCIFIFFQDQVQAARAAAGKAVDGALVVTEEPAIQTIDELENTGFGGEPREGSGLELACRCIGLSEALAGNFLVHDRFFESDDSAVEGIGVDYALDQGVRFSVGGTVFGFDTGAEVGDGFGDPGRDVAGFDGLRIQTVTPAVARGFAFSDVRDGSARPGAVAAGGFDLECGSHFRLHYA